MAEEVPKHNQPGGWLLPRPLSLLNLITCFFIFPSNSHSSQKLNLPLHFIYKILTIYAPLFQLEMFVSNLLELPPPLILSTSQSWRACYHVGVACLIEFQRYYRSIWPACCELAEGYHRVSVVVLARAIVWPIHHMLVIREGRWSVTTRTKHEMISFPPFKPSTWVQQLQYPWLDLNKETQVV